MQVKFKKLHHDAVLPSYSKEGDAGLDLTAISIYDTAQFIEYGFGLSVEIPPNYFGVLVPRSSITKRSLIMKNSLGIIDSGFRGELVCRFYVTAGGASYFFDTGERIAQLVVLPYPIIEPVFVDELSETERGYGGFGSTDKF